MDERILQVMRAMAWERAKAELMSMLHTYYGGTEASAEMDKTVRDFIAEVDSLT